MPEVNAPCWCATAAPLYVCEVPDGATRLDSAVENVNVVGEVTATTVQPVFAHVAAAPVTMILFPVANLLNPVVSV